jgi:tetratricopeptide (TPR) repeat protein
LGELARKTHDLKAAIDYLTCSRDVMEKLGAVEDLPEVYRQLAATHLAENNLALAHQHSERALEYAVKTGNRLEEGIVHRVLGQIALEQSKLDQAAERLAQSRVILQELGSEHELALTLVEEAALLEGAAQRQALVRALEILRRLGTIAEAEGVKRLMEAYGWPAA